MADFSALKTAIQTYIKQNGNEEITGEILQEILLSVVTTLGDSAINDLISALADEVAARQNADGTLQQNITNEATARGNADTALSNRLGSTITAENTAAEQIAAEAEAREAADTALQGLIDGITDNIENGYVYAGIATPSSTPTTGKVFYLALTAGTYTNFGSTEVSQGINILKYNGLAWSLDVFIGIDDTPTPNSPKLVKSGGTFESVMSNGSAFDISAHFSSGGTLATYADLSAALTALNTLSADYKRGGMSIKFVQSSDNKYIRYNLLADSFTTDTAQWAIDDAGVYVDNPEFAYVKTDSEGKILKGIKSDGTSYIAGDLQVEGNIINSGIQSQIDEAIEDMQQEVEEVLGSLDTDALNSITASENPEYMQVTTDSEGKIIEDITTEGRKEINIPIDIPAASFEAKDNPEWLSVTTDSEGRILNGRKKNGVAVENVGIEAKEIVLSNDGITRLKEDLGIGASDISQIYNSLSGTDVYTISQEGGKFGLIPRIFIEGLAKSNRGSVLRLNGGDSVIPENPNYVNVPDSTHTFEFTVSASGFQEIKDNITIHKHSASKAKNKDIKIMCIGDSLTDAGYAGVVEFIFKALNQDYGNNDIKALMVGTCRDSANIKLGNYEYFVRGYNEGRGGYAISDYLRHFTVVTSSKLHWDLLGLGTMIRSGSAGRTYVDYTGTAEQKELMRTTCHGWYDAEPTEEVWNWLKNGVFASVFANPFTFDGITYTIESTFAATSSSAIIAAVKYICQTNSLRKPVPFYDYNTVINSNGEYAFSMSVYLDRTKTLEADGTTRLVVGSTAGLWVEDANSYDVCKPTHIAIIMNQNDLRWDASGIAIANDLKLCADLIEGFDSNIQIAIGSTRLYGTFNPSSYTYYGYVGNFNFSKRQYDPWNSLRSILNETNFALLPLYVMQSPIGVGGGRAFDILDQKEKYNMVGDTLHTGENALSYLDRAYLVAAWVINTLS